MRQLWRQAAYRVRIPEPGIVRALDALDRAYF
jgi:hypothetical protein